MYDEDENLLGKVDEMDIEFIDDYLGKLSRKNKKLILSSIKYLQNKSMRDVLNIVNFVYNYYKIYIFKINIGVYLIKKIS